MEVGANDVKANIIPTIPIVDGTNINIPAISPMYAICLLKISFRIIANENRINDIPFRI